MQQYRFIDPDFLKLLNDLMEYGYEKHKEKSFQGLIEANKPLDTDRLLTCCGHAHDHLDAYQDGIPHDHFNTLEMQLAAVAANAMMEFVRVRYKANNKGE